MPVNPNLQTALGGLRAQIGARRRMLPGGGDGGAVGPGGAGGGGVGTGGIAGPQMPGGAQPGMEKPFPGNGGPGSGGIDYGGKMGGVFPGGTAGESPPWANLPDISNLPPEVLQTMNTTPAPMQFNDLLPTQLQRVQARGVGGGQRAGVGVNARGPAATAMQTQYGDTGPTAGGGVATPTGAGGVGAANPFMQDGVPQSPFGAGGGPLTLDAMPGAAGGGPPSGPIMDPAQQQGQLQTAMQGFQGRAGSTQPTGPGRFGGAPPPDVLARRRALMQRMSGLGGAAGAGGGGFVRGNKGG